ncbi:MAG: hypothetical protein FJ202_00880 [Gemmatimonadetes bacterium]|nr:hypothetical protein [Gemmatimonadota bacterium]
MTEGARDEDRPGRLAVRLLAVVVAVLAFLPWSSWLSGGISASPGLYPWSTWLFNTVAVSVLGALVAFLWIRWSSTSRVPDQLRTATSGSTPPRAWRAWHVDMVVAAACGAVYVAIAWWVFGGRPLLIDELVQVLQARVFAEGRFATPTDPNPEFFSVLHVVDIGPRTFAQFPPGWSAILAVGWWIGATWVIGPLCGAVAVFAFARFVRLVRPEFNSRVVVGSALVFGLGPFAAFQFASHMSHGPVVAAITLAMVASARAALAAQRVDDGLDLLAHGQPHRGLARWMALAGIAFGVAFAIRPLDALGFAVPALMWLAWSCVRGGQWRAVLSAAAGVAVGVIPVMAFNAATTGSPTVFGYEALWGASHGLGFHAAPWGDAHTPLRGFEIVSIYLARLNTYFLETPIPSLLPALVGLWVAPSLRPIERVLVVSTVLHATAYFAYWHDGFFLGPRFALPWILLLVLSCAWAADALQRRTVSRSFVRVWISASVVATLMVAAANGIPTRAAQYSSGLISMRQDYGSEALRAGARNALVFVRESWGAQVIARLWALGVSRAATATLYSRVDTCVLDSAVASLEGGAARGADVERALRPLLLDSARVVASSISPDTTERMIAGRTYGGECAARVQEDRTGYALYPPFLLDRTSGNRYARSLGSRDTLLLRRYPDLPAFLVTRSGVDGLAPLVWTRIR